MKSKPHSVHAGFTLIELPALSRAKAKAHALKCVSNLKQIGLANYMYFSDENKPVHYDPWPYLWMQLLQVRYQAINEVRFCPTAPERRPNQLQRDRSQEGWVTRAWLVDGGGTNYYQGSYALNGYLYSSSPYGDQPKMFRSESDIEFPSQTPYFADSIWVDAWPLETDRPARSLFDGDKFAEGGLSRIAIPRHVASAGAAIRNFDPKSQLPGAVNVGFADNHLETVRLERLWQLYWHKTWKPPARRPGL